MDFTFSKPVLLRKKNLPKYDLGNYLKMGENQDGRLFLQFLTNNSKTVAILVYLTMTKDEKHEKWKTMVYDASLYRDWFKSYTVCKSEMVASHFLFFANNSKTVAILVYLTVTKAEKHEK